jgi:SAM-dependent methyltransferase
MGGYVSLRNNFIRYFMKKIDWETYKDIYPDRYIQRSPFDDKVSSYISMINFLSQMPILILEIGGGINGSISEEYSKYNHCYLLDPFIPNCPEEYIDKVNWDTNFKFDLIVCRGAFNYLSIDEIKSIVGLLKPKGLFIFNTFSSPSEGTRTYKKDGIQAGFEKTILEKNILKHELHRDNGDIVWHDIIFYTTSEIEGFFEHSLITKESNNNSDYIIRKTR